jgi:hypothetical protein
MMRSKAALNVILPVVPAVSSARIFSSVAQLYARISIRAECKPRPA